MATFAPAAPWTELRARAHAGATGELLAASPHCRRAFLLRAGCVVCIRSERAAPRLVRALGHIAAKHVPAVDAIVRKYLDRPRMLVRQLSLEAGVDTLRLRCAFLELARAEVADLMHAPEECAMLFVPRVLAAEECWGDLSFSLAELEAGVVRPRLTPRSGHAESPP